MVMKGVEDALWYEDNVNHNVYNAEKMCDVLSHTFRSDIIFSGTSLAINMATIIVEDLPDGLLIIGIYSIRVNRCDVFP